MNQNCTILVGGQIRTKEDQNQILTIVEGPKVLLSLKPINTGVQTNDNLGKTIY